MVNVIKFVSIIIPCREEEKYIAQTLESIAANDYPQDHLEVLVVDGMSMDRTRKIVTEFSHNYPFIKLLDNPKKITPAALNIGISKAKGAIIMRVDSHSCIPPNYISSLVFWQEKTSADNVGGVCLNVPGSDTPMAKAIAMALSHPFGVGNAYFRIGTKGPLWVDTVPYGCFHRQVFSRIGTFDEDHVRSEDDEFNLRLKKSGGRLLLVPEIMVQYFTRDTLSKLWRMYYQYGYFKALVARKLGAVLKLRHIIPSLFLLTLASLFLLGALFQPLRPLGFLIFLAYLLANTAYALSAARREGEGLTVAACLFLVFPTLHFSYGLGFLKGLLDFFIFRKKRVRDSERVPLSR